MIRTLTAVFLGCELIQENQTLTWMNTWTVQHLWEALTTAFPKDATGVSHTPIIEQLRKVRFDFGEVPDPERAAQFTARVNTMLTESGQGQFNQKTAIRVLTDGLTARFDELQRSRTVGRINTLLHNRLKELVPQPETVCGFLAAITRLLREGVHAVAVAKDWIDIDPTPDNTKRQRLAGSGWSQQPSQKKTTQPGQNPSGLCLGCGRNYKGIGLRCTRCEKHPDRNMEDIPFIGSVPHRKQLAIPGIKYPDALNLTRRADGSPLTPEQTKALEEAKQLRTETSGSGILPADRQPQQQQHAHGGRGRQGNAQGGRFGGRHSGRGGRGRFHGEQLIAIDVDDDNEIILPSFIISTATNNITVETLLDTGALQGNYISPGIADWLKGNGASVHEGVFNVQLAVRDMTFCCTSQFSLNVTFLNENTRQTETLFDLNAKVLDSHFQLIIGRPTIIKHRLCRKLPSFFDPDDATAPVESEILNFLQPCAQPGSSASTLDRLGPGKASCSSTIDNSQPSPVARNQLCIIGEIKSKRELLANTEPDIDEVNWPEDPFDNIFSGLLEDSSLTDKITIVGALHQQNKIRKLCCKYVDIFSESVRSNPAEVPPMELKVNSSKWQSNKNRGPPRPQSREKQKEISKQVNNYLKLGVIKPVNASEYSQVHLVPKPTPNEWRFCLDFVRLNDSTEGTDGWPIPNISEMINRIGSRKSKVFGFMDMTSGYHQAPISAASQIFTAFICFMGIFCWLRVPMGLKNAASHFQRVMATVVLSGLIYLLCELYIDDILVFGANDDEFVHNLEEVFKRLRKYKVTLNPKKCRFGLDSVEYVGHVISAEGVTFSKEKREKVLDFPLPNTQKELQAFLGLINYFRDHVPSMIIDRKRSCDSKRRRSVAQLRDRE